MQREVSQIFRVPFLCFINFGVRCLRIVRFIFFSVYYNAFSCLPRLYLARTIWTTIKPNRRQIQRRNLSRYLKKNEELLCFARSVNNSNVKSLLLIQATPLSLTCGKCSVLNSEAGLNASSSTSSIISIWIFSLSSRSFLALLKMQSRPQPSLYPNSC